MAGRKLKEKRRPANLTIPAHIDFQPSGLSPISVLRAQLPNLKGKEKESLEDFIFNKGRFLQAQDLNSDAFERISGLGNGDGRSVYKVRHKQTDLVLVQKVVHYDGKPETHTTLARELDLMHDCSSPQIVGFYGSFLNQSEVNIIMEYMDGGCLDDVLQRVGRMPETPLAHISSNVLDGLVYLAQNRMIHRDLKPANILVNTKGEVKLCDFGVSRKLFETLRVQTFVGTMRYMSPERLSGDDYTNKGDIWSLGISLIELASGYFPFTHDHPPLAELRDPQRPGYKKQRKKEELAVFDVMHEVLQQPSPTLPEEGMFSPDFQDFVNKCLIKEPDRRPDADQLIMHPWLLGIPAMDLAGWVQSTLPPTSDDDDDEDCEYESSTLFA